MFDLPFTAQEWFIEKGQIQSMCSICTRMEEQRKADEALKRVSRVRSLESEVASLTRENESLRETRLRSNGRITELFNEKVKLYSENEALKRENMRLTNDLKTSHRERDFSRSNERYLSDRVVALEKANKTLRDQNSNMFTAGSSWVGSITKDREIRNLRDDLRDSNAEQLRQLERANTAEANLAGLQRKVNGAMKYLRDHFGPLVTPDENDLKAKINFRNESS